MAPYQHLSPKILLFTIVLSGCDAAPKAVALSESLIYSETTLVTAYDATLRATSTAEQAQLVANLASLSIADYYRDLLTSAPTHPVYLGTTKLPIDYESLGSLAAGFEALDRVVPNLGELVRQLGSSMAVESSADFAADLRTLIGTPTDASGLQLAGATALPDVNCDQMRTWHLATTGKDIDEGLMNSLASSSINKIAKAAGNKVGVQGRALQVWRSTEIQSYFIACRNQILSAHTSWDSLLKKIPQAVGPYDNGRGCPVPIAPSMAYPGVKALSPACNSDSGNASDGTPAISGYDESPLIYSSSGQTQDYLSNSYLIPGP